MNPIIMTVLLGAALAAELVFVSERNRQKGAADSLISRFIRGIRGENVPLALGAGAGFMLPGRVPSGFMNAFARAERGGGAGSARDGIVSTEHSPAAAGSYGTTEGPAVADRPAAEPDPQIRETEHRQNFAAESGDTRGSTEEPAAPEAAESPETAEMPEATGEPESETVKDSAEPAAPETPEAGGEPEEETANEPGEPAAPDKPEMTGNPEGETVKEPEEPAAPDLPEQPEMNGKQGEGTLRETVREPSAPSGWNGPTAGPALRPPREARKDERAPVVPSGWNGPTAGPALRPPRETRKAERVPAAQAGWNGPTAGPALRPPKEVRKPAPEPARTPAVPYGRDGLTPAVPALKPPKKDKKAARERIRKPAVPDGQNGSMPAVPALKPPKKEKKAARERVRTPDAPGGQNGPAPEPSGKARKAVRGPVPTPAVRNGWNGPTPPDTDMMNPDKAGADHKMAFILGSVGAVLLALAVGTLALTGVLKGNGTARTGSSGSVQTDQESRDAASANNDPDLTEAEAPATSTPVPEAAQADSELTESTVEPTAVPTDTPEPTAVPTDTPEPTAVPTDTPEPTAAPTDTPEPTAAPTDTPVPTATPTYTPEPTAEITLIPTVTSTPEPVDTPTPIQEITPEARTAEPAVQVTTAASPAGRFPVQARTTVKKVNVRSEPDISSERIAVVGTAGTAVTVIGEANDAIGRKWYRILLEDGKEGYMMAEYLQEEEDSSAEQVTPSSAQGAATGSTPGESGGNGLYGLAIQELVTRDGPSRNFNETGTYDLMGQQVRILARAHDALSGTWWVKCEIPVNGETRILWTNYFRFEPDSLPLNSIPLE